MSEEKMNVNSAKDFQRLAKYGIAREILTNILLS